MKAEVDKDRCMRCELCTYECPEVYKMVGSFAEAYVNPVPAKYESAVLQTAEECPVAAISIE